MEMISVIVPTFNDSEYLRECLFSIQKQTLRNIEVIVVDDGSVDQTKEIVTSFCASDNRFRYIYQKNSGVSVARNTGIENAQGDLITFVDGDDFIHIDYLQNLVNCFKTNNHVDVAVTSFRIIGGDWRAERHKSTPIWMTGRAATTKMLQQDGFDVSCWGKMYRRNLFCNKKFLSDVIYEDMLLTTELLMEARYVVFIDEGLYSYRKTANSLINSPFSGREFSIFKVSENLKLIIDEKDIDLRQALAEKIFSTVSSVLRKMRNEPHSSFYAERRKLIDLAKSEVKYIKVTRVKRFKTKIMVCVFRANQGVYQALLNNV
ncbi:glycosyltransferase [Weissella confusa]|uniref:Glycosyltransferase family 2 protein n=1 Tax=Weissella fermenti TaxID=2987699 RepID=A0ABT6D119_9LACO|nr:MULTISPECIES: glycosyltransferase family 2 protein [Weissella]MBJ7689114.1 glycosyltransferase [Weissella confusa]MCW0926699.1 glycosyltransferase [Weissella sp. LMG 11983]MDF9299129.1 glycosyltransferase family 2 protein [Weissella sp. BK2]